jgi:hypothetical protein
MERSDEWIYVVKCEHCGGVKLVPAEFDSAGDVLPAHSNLICRVCHASVPITDEMLQRKDDPAEERSLIKRSP